MSADVSYHKPYAYIVVFDGVTIDDFTARIDSFPEVLNWYSVLPNTVFLVSHHPAKQLSETIRTRIRNVSRLLVVDANNPKDRSGWLPSKAWDFLRDPKPVGSKK